MEKLIVFDIDGTLRDECLGIPESIPGVLKMLKQKGHKTAICTGRSMGKIQDDVLELKVDSIISGGGSRIKHKDSLLFDEAFDRETIQQLLKHCKAEQEPAGYVFEGSDELFMNQTAAQILNRLNQEKCSRLTEVQKKRYYENEKIQYEPNIEKLSSEQTNIQKICVWCQPKEYNRIKDIIGTDQMELAQQDASKDFSYYEIIKKGCGKGAGVTRLCEALGISLEHTVVFGDGKNDIDMFQVCGSAVAMSNGVKELFAYADSICGAPFEDGIYMELKQRKMI